MAQSMHNSKPPTRGIRQHACCQQEAPHFILQKLKTFLSPKLLGYWKWGLLSNTAEPHTSSLHMRRSKTQFAKRQMILNVRTSKLYSNLYVSQNIKCQNECEFKTALITQL